MAHGAPDDTGMKSDVVLRPEWAALEGNAKLLQLVGYAKAYGEVVEGVYVVPAGKTFVITDASWESYAYYAEDADNRQQSNLVLLTSNPEGCSVISGGDGGGAVSLPTPIVLTGGDSITYQLGAAANHLITMQMTARGFET